MTTTPLLNIPELPSSDPNKFLIHNQSFKYIEALCGAGVLEIRDTPPSSPSEGNLYIVGENGSGAFLDQDNNLAYFTNNDWLFIIPIQGIKVIVNVFDQQYYYTGQGWQNLYDLNYVYRNEAIIDDARTNAAYGLDGTREFNLPEGINEGDRLMIIDHSGNFADDNLTVNSSGSNTINDASTTSIILNGAFNVTELIFSNNIWRVTVSSSNNTTTPVTGTLTYLDADPSFYIANSTGLDTNSGTVGSPFKTFARALTEISTLDLRESDVDVILTEDYDATDADVIDLPNYKTSKGVCRIRGDSASRAIIFNAGYTQIAKGLFNLVDNSQWYFKDLIFDSSNVGAVQNIIFCVGESSSLYLGYNKINNLTFNLGSTAGTTCIKLNGGSSVFIEGDSNNPIAIQGNSTNPIFYFIQAFNNSNVVTDIEGVTFDLGTNLNPIASGGALYSLNGRCSAQLYYNYLNTINGIGLRYSLEGNCYLKRDNDPPGNLTTDSISSESLLAN